MADGTATTIVRRADALHVRAVREASREVDFIASTETIDSYDEIVDQASWDLTRFEKNPIILYQHDRWSLPIGQATRCEVVKGQLEVTIKFATGEANPEAEKIWLLVQEKVLRAVSVGFKPFDGKYEMRDGRDVYVLYKCQLREISVVTVPANEDCLALMKAASLNELGVCTAAAGHEAETVRGSRTGEMRERLRSAIAARDEATTRTQITPERSAPSTNTTTSAPKGATETIMTDSEKALQEKLDKSLLAIAELKLEAKTATEAKTKAESDVRSGEATVKALTTEKAALEAQTKSLVEARDAEKLRADTAESQLIELEVESQVGPDKKIAPAEKEMFVELRKTNPELFKKMLAQRSPMTLGKSIVPPGTLENGGAPTSIGANAATDIDEEIEKFAS